MKYKRLVLENFRTFHEKHEFVFPDKNGLVILHAKNGTGKSALLHALNFVLYGRAVDPSNLQGGYFPYYELLNRIAFGQKKYTFGVTLELVNGKDNFEIDRRVQIKKGVKIKDPKEDNFYEEYLHVTKNSEVLSLDDSQKEIENLMSEAVARFFLVNREEVDRLNNALTDERENEIVKREIEKSIGVEVLERGKEILSDIANEFSKESAKDTSDSKKANDARDNLLGALERSDKSKKNITALKKELDSVENKIKKLEEKQLSLKSISEEAENKKQLSEEVFNLEKNKKEKVIQIREYLIENWFLPVSDIALSSYDAAKRNQDDAEEIKRNIKNLETEILKLEKEIKDEVCTSCGQAIKKTQVNQSTKLLKSKQLQKEEFEAEYQEPTSIFPSTQIIAPFVKPSIEAFSQLEKDLANIEIDIHKTQNKIDKINKNFDDSLVVEVKDVMEKLNKLKELKLTLKRDLDEEETLNTAFVNQIKKYEKEVDKFTSDTKTSTKKSQFSKGLRELFEIAFTLYRDSARKDVAILAKSVFDNLINDRGHQIEIEEDYSVTLTDDKGENAGTPSKGQAGIIALSLITALSRNSVTNAPIILDSPMAGLDDDHKMKVWSFVHELADQVILFVFPGEYKEDHRKHFKKHLVKEYTLHKKEGIFSANIVEGHHPEYFTGGK